jgi:hypothetical protein
MARDVEWVLLRICGFRGGEVVLWEDIDIFERAQIIGQNPGFFHQWSASIHHGWVYFERINNVNYSR